MHPTKIQTNKQFILPKNMFPSKTKLHMDLPLFPLNLVLFPGQQLPLHIFEPRYREMIGYCLEKDSPFGIVLLREGKDVGPLSSEPHVIGTAARIVEAKRMPDGRMYIMVTGTKRFQVKAFDQSRSYLSGEVVHFPVVNGSTQRAVKMAQLVRPRVLEYVEALSAATNSKLPLNRLPEDPTSLAFLIAMALQVSNDEKQKLLALPGIPEILTHENYLLWREVSLLQHMVQSQEQVMAQTSGPTGYLFTN